MKKIALLILITVSVLQLSAQEKGAEKPYISNTHDIFCPTITLSGKAVVANKKEKLFFNAIADGSSALRYRWSVVGGRLLSGQGTPKISVRINRSLRMGEGMGVTATLRLTGLPEGGNCMDKFSFTTILAPIPIID